VPYGRLRDIVRYPDHQGELHEISSHRLQPFCACPPPASAQTLDDLKKTTGRTPTTSSPTAWAHQQRYSRVGRSQEPLPSGGLVPGVEPEASTYNWGEQKPSRIVPHGVMFSLTNCQGRSPSRSDVANRQDRSGSTRSSGSVQDTARVVCYAAFHKGAADLTYGKVLPHHAGRPRHRARRRKERQGVCGSRRPRSGRTVFSLTIRADDRERVLITGISGAEFGVRRFIDGMGSGKRQAPVAPLQPSPTAREGNETWPQATAGRPGRLGLDHRSYDPRARSHVTGIGNPAPWASQTRPGDNLYTSSVPCAMRPRTGEVVWVLPVHAERRLRLRRLLGADSRRSQRAGPPRKVAMQLNRKRPSSTCSIAPMGL